jgi:hypothetical protein
MGAEVSQDHEGAYGPHALECLKDVEK